MVDKRKFSGSFSVRIDTRRARFELSPAEIHGGPEGSFRVRIDRKWYDGPDGKPLFFDRSRLADLVVGAALEGLPEPATQPGIQRGDRVSVRFEKGGVRRVEGGFVAAAPILGHDGRWWVPVTMYGGTRYVPADDIIAKEGNRGRTK
jgi:hypothetical protein